MDIKGNGVEVSLDLTKQSDEWLLGAAQEIAEVARERGLELPYATGLIAVQGAMQAAETAVEAPTAATKESFVDQLPFASKGYQGVVDSLNEGRRGKDILEVATEKTLAAEFEAWFTDDKLAYVVATQEADPSVRFTLVAIPNVLASPEEVIKAAKAFGQNQPRDTDVWDEIYHRYSAKQLSGTNPENGNVVQFSLIPSSYTPNMKGTVVEQRTRLAKMQAQNPSLKVPSVLETIAYWQTLRAQGERLADDTTFYRTDILHFNLPKQRMGDEYYIPSSCVYSIGRPRLGDANVKGNYNANARIAMG